MTTTKLCTYCQEREGVTYINKFLSCGTCYRKFLKAKAFITANHTETPKAESTPRTWASTFTTPDGRRQTKYHGPTHVQTSEPIIRGTANMTTEVSH